jgi:hypothetical protein
MQANVQSITLIQHEETKELVTEPIQTRELTPEDRAFYAVGSVPGVLVRFPLSVLTRSAAIRVRFDRTARGVSGSTTCLDCVVPIDVRRIR